MKCIANWKLENNVNTMRRKFYVKGPFQWLSTENIIVIAYFVQIWNKTLQNLF